MARRSIDFAGIIDASRSVSKAAPNTIAKLNAVIANPLTSSVSGRLEPDLI